MFLFHLFYFNKNISLLSHFLVARTQPLVSNSILCMPCVSRSFRCVPCFSFLLYVGMHVKVVFIATTLAPIDTRYYNCTVYSGLECRLCDLPIAIINCFTHEYDSTIQRPICFRLNDQKEIERPCAAQE